MEEVRPRYSYTNHNTGGILSFEDTIVSNLGQQPLQYSHYNTIGKHSLDFVLSYISGKMLVICPLENYEKCKAIQCRNSCFCTKFNRNPWAYISKKWSKPYISYREDQQFS